MGKDDWKYIATTFKIPYENSHTKEHIRNIVMEAFSSEILPEVVEERAPQDLGVNQGQPPTPSNENSSTWNEHRLAFERERLQVEL